MLKKMSIKKIMVSSLAALILLIIYLIPGNKENIDLENSSIEYTYNNIASVIYLLDNNDYVSRTTIPTCACSASSLAKDLIEGLMIDGKKSNIIPNGFRSIIPPGVTLLSLNLENKILTIDFSKELLEVPKEVEEKMIESLVYTLTSIDGIDKIKILVESSPLKYLPNSKTVLPEVLDKSYGINKDYDITTTNNITSYTIYYVNKYKDSKYYVPVTKYVNSTNEDTIKVIVKELSSSPIYETNLMSYLNSNVSLLDYKYEDGTMKLNFNELLFSNKESKTVLEEVIYTISLSLDSMYDNLKEVSFLVNNEEVYNMEISKIK